MNEKDFTASIAEESLQNSPSEPEKEKEKELKEYEAARAEAESLRQQLETLKADMEQEKTAHSAEIKAIKLDCEVEKALLIAGAKNLKAVGSLLDREQIDIDEKGGPTGLAEQLEALKQSDPYLFKEQEQAENTVPFGGFAAYAPEEGIDESADDVNFSQMTYSQITEYLAENKN